MVDIMELDYTTFRMLHCSECKRAHNNDGCRGTNNEIDNCIDASAPFDDVGYMYGA
jgi:hypothetical protein